MAVSGVGFANYLRFLYNVAIPKLQSAFSQCKPRSNCLDEEDVE